MIFKPKFIFQQVRTLLTVIFSLIILCIPLETKALTAEEQSIVAAITGTDGSTEGVSTGIRNGIDDLRTGYIAYILSEDGADVGLPAYGFSSPSYESTKIAGSESIIESRRGHSITSFKGAAPWNIGPFSDSGGSNQAIIKSWMTTRNGGVLNSVQFINDNWGVDTAEKFITGKYVLVLETILNFQYGYPSSGGTYKEETATSIQLEYPGLSLESAEAIAKAVNAINKLKTESGYETKGSPILGTIVNCIDYYNNSISPMGNYFKRYTHGIAAFTMRVDRDIARFVKYPYVITPSKRFTDDEIRAYGLGTSCFKCVEDMQTTAEGPPDTPQVPHNPPLESLGHYTIIKLYRTREGNNPPYNYIDDGRGIRDNVASNIFIENEGIYQIVEWKITDTIDKNISSIDSTDLNPPGKIQSSGKYSTTVQIEDGYKCLYVLLEKIDEEPEEKLDYNYKITESSITRRIRLSKPDNPLEIRGLGEGETIKNYTFKWTAPAHEACKGHTFTDDCKGTCEIGRETVTITPSCPDDCEEDHTHIEEAVMGEEIKYGDCGENCQTQTAYCTGWELDDKELKLSLRNANQEAYPEILTAKEDRDGKWYLFTNEDSTTNVGYVGGEEGFDRQKAEESETYQETGWDYICIIHRGQDKLNLAEWINSGYGSHEENEAGEDLADIGAGLYYSEPLNKSSGKRKQNGFYNDSFVVAIDSAEHGVDGVDNQTIYAPNTGARVEGQEAKGSTICEPNEIEVYLLPLTINVAVRVEVYKGLPEGGTVYDGYEEGQLQPGGNTGYDVSNGVMVELPSISFIPYIEMKYDTMNDDNLPAFVMGEYTRTIKPISYGEINWNPAGNSSLRRLIFFTLNWA